MGEKGRDIKLEIYIQIRERKIQTLRKRERGGWKNKGIDVKKVSERRKRESERERERTRERESERER